MDVIIVGAGATGLMAARELSKKGKKVLILEARDRIGGRIHPLPPKDFGYEAQAGAEFVHGPAPITSALAEEMGLSFQQGGEWWSVRDGEPKQMEGGLMENPELIEALKKLTEDCTVAEFLESNFPGKKYADLRDFIYRFTEGYDAADPEKASAFNLRDALDPEKTESLQRTIKEGYGEIIRFLQKECERHGVSIILNAQVLTIDLSGSRVSVRCSSGPEYTAEKVLVTVPLPLIETIKFTPDMSEKFSAIKKLGFGNVIKMLIRFKSRWWAGMRQNIFERLFFMFSDEEIPTWWTQYPEPHSTLTGWTTASRASELKDKPEKEILEIALRSLSNIFSIGLEELRSELVHYHVANWPKDPYARGAYSYRTPHSDAAVEELLKPVSGKLYFAGEALAPQGTFATVEGAFASGQEVAQKMFS